MLAATRPTSRGYAPRLRVRDDSFLSVATRRITAFVLARPGTVALMLLFGGLGAAVSANALWMQSEHHPAPLFHQAALQPQRPAAIPIPPRKTPETPASASGPGGRRRRPRYAAASASGRARSRRGARPGCTGKAASRQASGEGPDRRSARRNGSGAACAHQAGRRQRASGRKGGAPGNACARK